MTGPKLWMQNLTVEMAFNSLKLPTVKDVTKSNFVFFFNPGILPFCQNIAFFFKNTLAGVLLTFKFTWVALYSQTQQSSWLLGKKFPSLGIYHMKC